VVVPTACGVVLALAAVLVEGGRTVSGAAGLGKSASGSAPRLAVLIVALGMGLAGLLDDLAGGAEARTTRGFRGHLTALREGRLTTGAMKLVMGAAVALVAVATARPYAVHHSLGRLLADAALVALSANLSNLLDRAPGRAGKVGLLAFVGLALGTTLDASLSAVAVVVGATGALLPDDLRERAMLGDTGANILGGVLGLGVVAACSPMTRTVVLIVVAALNLVSELVSFSRVIDRVPPLRKLDQVGRLPH
jgi:UDP-N-acetylmuramyl pentapeptide phosphotransferase/UDP-N-acetylglucosamine-1-phosphate transferase